MQNKWIKAAISLGTAAVLFAGVINGAAAQQGSGDDQSGLVQRVSDAVIQRLQRSGALDKAVDAGIQRYIAREEAAHQAAQQRQQADAARKAAEVRPVSMTRDHIFGNPHAPVSIIEYADFECPYCKRFHATPRKLVEAFGGRVNWVYRYFPLGFHNPAADQEAEAAECVAALGGNDEFWKYADLLYANSRSNGDGVPPTKLAALAAGLGIDKARFNECANSNRYAKLIQGELQEGEAAGVLGTPGNILRDNRSGKVLLRTGARSYASLKADIDGLLQ